MLRCSVSAREVLLERAPVDEVGAAAGSQRHARDRRLALARRAVARAGGEVDRGRGDRRGKLVLLVLLDLRVHRGRPRPRSRTGPRSRRLAAPERIDALGDDVHLEVRARHRRLARAARLLRCPRPRARPAPPPRSPAGASTAASCARAATSAASSPSPAGSRAVGSLLRRCAVGSACVLRGRLVLSLLRGRLGLRPAARLRLGRLLALGLLRGLRRLGRVGRLARRSRASPRRPSGLDLQRLRVSAPRADARARRRSSAS